MERERRRDGGLGGTKRAEDFIALEDGGEDGGRLLREDENDSDGADEDFDDLRVSGYVCFSSSSSSRAAAAAADASPGPPREHGRLLQADPAGGT